MIETGHFVQLTRQAYFPWGTFGELNIGGRRLATCEPPWLDNTPSTSCIPEGVYEVIKHRSPRFGDCFAVVGERVGLTQGSAERWGILFHIANFPDELQGCIAPGLSLGVIPLGAREFPRTLGVTRSRAAFAHLMNIMPDMWHLEITHIEAQGRMRVEE